MKLPRHKSQQRQRHLFDTKLLNGGASRYWTGDFFEQAAANVSHGKRFQTQGDCDICPDIHWRDDVYFENKAVGQSSSVIIYSARLRKDLDFQHQHACVLYYWLWCHKFKVTSVDTITELREGLAANLVDVLVVDYKHIYDLLSPRPEKLLNKAYSKSGQRLGYGTSSKGYGWGWGLPVSELRPLCQTVRTVTCQAYDQRMKDVTIRFKEPESARFIERGHHESQNALSGGDRAAGQGSFWE